MFIQSEFDLSKSRHHQHLIPKGSLGANKKTVTHTPIKGRWHKLSMEGFYGVNLFSAIFCKNGVFLEKPIV
jgi:hypothetical protein